MECKCDVPRKVKARNVKAVVRGGRIRSLVRYDWQGNEFERTGFAEPESYKFIVYCRNCGQIINRRKPYA